MILDIIYGTLDFFMAHADMVKITEFMCGDRLRLVDFGQTGDSYRRRLLSLGITRGVEMLVLKVAPLGCPILVEVRGTMIALRKEEACHLHWERL